MLFLPIFTMVTDKYHPHSKRSIYIIDLTGKGFDSKFSLSVHKIFSFHYVFKILIIAITKAKQQYI